MLTWLKWLGQEIIKGTQWVFAHESAIGVAGTLASAAIPGTAVPEILKIITDIEVIGQTANWNGENKLAAALPLVRAALMKYLPANVQPKDAALFDKAVLEVTQGFVDFANSYQVPTTPAA